MFRHRLSPSGPFLESGLINFVFAAGVPAEDVEIPEEDPVLLGIEISVPNVSIGDRLLIQASVNLRTVGEAVTDAEVRIGAVATGAFVVPAASKDSIVVVPDSEGANEMTCVLIHAFTATAAGDAVISLTGITSSSETFAIAAETFLAVSHIQPA